MTSECTKKTVSLEKEVVAMRTILEDLQRTVKSGGGRQSANGAGAAARHSTPEVCIYLLRIAAKKTVHYNCWLLYSECRQCRRQGAILNGQTFNKDCRLAKFPSGKL